MPAGVTEPMQTLVAKYFEMNGYFLRSNIKYDVPGNYSDVDLVGVNKEGEWIVIEVTAWARGGVTEKTVEKLIQCLNEKMNIVEKLVDKKRLKGVIAVLPSTDKQREGIRDLAKTAGVEVVFLDEIIQYFFDELEVGQSYESEGLQLIRFIKIIREKKDDGGWPK